MEEPMVHVASAEVVLAVWEAGIRQPCPYGALLLLAATRDDATLESLADLPVGERNRRLLDLRERLFGSDISSVTDCPSCRERVELQFPVSGLRAGPSLAIADGDLTLETRGYRLTFRLPNSRDLLDLPPGPVAEGRRWLAARCVSNAQRRGKRVSPTSVPDSVLRALSDRLAEADPQAVMEVSLECPACGHRWMALFEIASFLWDEIDRWARRLLRDVHHLASAYGWGESDILRLTPWRRQAYLEMLAV